MLAALLVPAAICAAWTVLAGKDVNWDLLNYHYYLGYELLGGRLSQDFFAASAQSYLNPVGYLPFYAMASGWHSALASIALAALHGSSLTFLFLLARKLFGHLPRGEQLTFSLLGTALGASTWVFWPTVGSSFLDPLLAPAILAGLLLLLGAAPRPGLAGALLGAAAALKYSNAIYVLAAFPLAFATAGRLRGAAAYVLGAALAVAALAGPWLALLAREFGNPVFPLMNAWFESPHAPAVNLVSERFAPRGLGEALLLPFRMVTLDRHLYSETFAPDLRVAALCVAFVTLPFMRHTVRGNALQGNDGRLFVFLAAGWVLWVMSSANARYGLPVLFLAGLALARLVERLLPQNVARIALAALLVLQVALCVFASPMRWYLAEPWSSRWLPYAPPERAPALYLSVEVLPMAVVAPFLHPASSFVNFAGQHSLPSDAPRLTALLEQHRGRVRALGRRLALADGKPDAAALQAYDAALRRLGYRVDATDCFTIAWRPEEDALSRSLNKISMAAGASEPLSVGSCALVAQPRDAADLEAERRASALFERIEKRCRALFRGQTAVTEPFGSGWSRNYAGLDARLEAFGGGVILHRHRSAALLDLGRLADWERDDSPLPAECR